MEKKLKIAERIAKLLDNQFEIFGFRFGLDPLLGLIPGIGGVLTSILGIYIIKLGYEMKLPQKEITKMWLTMLADVFIGAVPVIGDAADFVFKSNWLNLQTLKRYYQSNQIIEGEIVS